jgi:hypothetical protein
VNSGTPRPLLACAQRAGREFLTRKTAEGVITGSTAYVLYEVGFPFIVRTIAAMRQSGTTEQAITDWLATETAAAATTGEPLAQIGAEFYAAVWNGMLADQAGYSGR